METLPTEIKVQVFNFLFSLSDVKSLNQISPSFHEAFVSSKNFIIQKLVKNRLDPELLREIQAVARSLHMKVWSREEVLEILGSYFSSQPRIMAAIKWDMSTTLVIDQLQTLIDDFSAHYASTALTDGYESNREADSRPVTVSESRRFNRNFWKFELYCNLFRDHLPNKTRPYQQRFSTKEQKSLFPDHFAALENEQLGYIHLYRGLP